MSLIGKPLIPKMMPTSSRHDFRFFVDLACSVTDIQWLMSHGLHGGLISGKSHCSKVFPSMIYSEMRYDRILWDSTACNEPRREWWVWRGPLFTELSWQAQNVGKSRRRRETLGKALNYELRSYISHFFTSFLMCSRFTVAQKTRAQTICVFFLEVLLY